MAFPHPQRYNNFLLLWQEAGDYFLLYSAQDSSVCYKPFPFYILDYRLNLKMSANDSDLTVKSLHRTELWVQMKKMLEKEMQNLIFLPQSYIIASPNISAFQNSSQRA